MFHGSGTGAMNFTASIGFQPSSGAGLRSRPRSQPCQRSQSGMKSRISGATAPGVECRATMSASLAT